MNIALAELGQEIAETLNLKDGIPALSKKIGELVKDFKNLDDDTQKFIINAALLAAAIPPITLVLGALISSIATITTAVIALNPLIYRTNICFRNIINNFFNCKSIRNIVW